METGDIDLAHEFLRNNGVGVASKRVTYQVGDGPSTNSFDRDDLDITLDLYYGLCTGGSGTYYASINWYYDWALGDNGDDPNDVAAIHYDKNWWNTDGDSVSEAIDTSDYVEYADGSYGGEGPGFTVDDQGADWAGDEDDYFYGGVYLNEIGDYSESQRAVLGEYQHNWTEESTSISSVSVSYPAGISVSFTNEEVTKSWKTDTEQDGDTWLEVYQKDASGC